MHLGQQQLQLQTRIPSSQMLSLAPKQHQEPSKLLLHLIQHTCSK